MASMTDGHRTISVGTPATSLPDPDEALLPALRRGEEAAFEQLVRMHGPRLLAVARRLLRNDDDARDAVQQTFLSAFKGLPGFNGQSRLATWLHRIVVNVSLMRLRTRSRKPEESIEDMLPRFVEDGHQAEPAGEWPAGAFEILMQEETRARVRAAVDHLPESYRAVLMLRDIEELDTKETARVLGTTTTAVKTRLHRARQALAKQFESLFRPQATA